MFSAVLGNLPVTPFAADVFWCPSCPRNLVRDYLAAMLDVVLTATLPAVAPLPPPAWPPLCFPGRDPRLPQMWALNGHPLLAHAPSFKRFFLVMHDSRVRSMKRFYNVVKNELRLPRGTDVGLAEAGASWQRR